MATANQVRALRFEESTLRRLSAGLRNATALVIAPQRSPFDNFGVLAARNLAPRKRPALDAGFTVKDARERIAEFLDNTFRPESLFELVGYLRQRLLHIEHRRQPDGGSANYLIDGVSKQSVLAASVDRRLSRPGLARMFGRTLDAEVEAAARMRVQQETPEQTEARRLRSFNATRLRGRAGDPDAPPFGDWDDMRFSAQSMFRGREITVQGTEVWAGFELARASDDPAANLRLYRDLRAQGHNVIVPAKTREDAEAGRFVPGMPLVAREGAVRTRLIAKSLSYAKLTETFQQSPFAYFEEMARRMGRQTPAPNKVVELAAFRDRFRRVEAPEPIQPAIRPEVVRQVLIRIGVEQLTVFDPSTGHEHPFDPTKLPAGRYNKEDGFGLPAGFVLVDADGGYAHLDEDERYHNAFGPALVPPKGSQEPPRWAMNGDFLTKVEFQARTTYERLLDRTPARPEPEPEPEPDLGPKFLPEPTPPRPGARKR